MPARLARTASTSFSFSLRLSSTVLVFASMAENSALIFFHEIRNTRTQARGAPFRGGALFQAADLARKRAHARLDFGEMISACLRLSPAGVEVLRTRIALELVLLHAGGFNSKNSLRSLGEATRMRRSALADHRIRSLAENWRARGAGGLLQLGFVLVDEVLDSRRDRCGG